MKLPWKRKRSGWTPPPADPAAVHPGPWPVPVVITLALAGLLSPLIPLAGAAAAFGFADKDQGTILTGAGLMHMVLALTFMAGA